MAKKKLKQDYTEKTLPELKKLLADLRAEMAKISVEKNARRLKNVMLLGKKKKEIAQILTIIKQKETSV